MIKFNIVKKIIVISCLMSAVSPVWQLQSAALVPNSALFGKAELVTAILRGPLAGYGQKVRLESGKLSNKALLIGACTNTIRIINDLLAMYNASQKEDLALNNNGKHFQQYLTLMFLLQDVVGLCSNAKNFWVNRTKDDQADEIWQQAQAEIEHVSGEKLTRVAKRLCTYVLPLIESVAATARAVDSMNVEYGKERLELTNYLCFVAIAGCRNLSEYLQTKRGSSKQNWAIAKTIICAATILWDLKRHDDRRIAEAARIEALRVAAVEATRQANEQRVAAEGRAGAAGIAAAEANVRAGDAERVAENADRLKNEAEQAAAQADFAKNEAIRAAAEADRQKAAAEQRAQAQTEAARQANEAVVEANRQKEAAEQAAHARIEAVNKEKDTALAQAKEAAAREKAETERRAHELVQKAEAAKAAAEQNAQVAKATQLAKTQQEINP